MKTIKRALHLQERGSALALVLSVLVILLLMGTGLLNLGLQNRLAAIRTASEIAARSAADAGLTKALFEMNQMLQVKPWDDSGLPEATNEMLSNCDATLSYTISEDDGVYTIESAGYCGRIEKTVSGVLRFQGLFEYAIFAKGNIDLKAGATVDWYNYGEDDENLKVGSHSTAAGSIALKNKSTVNGDVVVGVGGDPDIVINDNGADITGRTYAMMKRQHMPPITVPEWLGSLPSGRAIKKNTEISSSGKYDEIDLKKNKEIEIVGNVTLYVVGDVILGKSAQVVIDDDDASLIMYIGGDVEGKSGSAFNNKSKDAKKLKIYGLNTCNNLRFKNSTVFYGAIYALDADVIFDNSADAFGSVAAKSFKQKNSAAFHYDASLRDISANDEGVRFTVKRWQEK